MKKNDTKYIFLFALGVCVVCSFVLAAVSKGLQPRRELNEAIDVKKNILKAAISGFSLKGKRPDEVLADYKKNIKEIVINLQGEIIKGRIPGSIKEGAPFLPVYLCETNGQLQSYTFPISGKGLWSTMYGYLSLEPDGETIKAVTFYKHGETPGLGGEIEQDWFQQNFKGKKIWDEGKNNFVGVAVVKGKVEDKVQQEQRQYYVDGISGATMTSKGVTDLLADWLQSYKPFLDSIREKK